MFKKNVRKINCEPELYQEFHELIQHIGHLEKEYTLGCLRDLKEKVRKLARRCKVQGYEDASSGLLDLAMDLGVQEENFYLSTIRLDKENVEKRLLEIAKFFNVQSKAGDRVFMEPSKTKRKVVLVDDDEDLTKLLTHEFHGIGFEVQSFVTGQAALTFLLQKENLQDVFLLVLDRMLPDMDGLDILQKFLENSDGRIPVLIISVLSAEKDILEGLQKGAVDYISKPFSIFMLMQKALNLLKMQGPSS